MSTAALGAAFGGLSCSQQDQAQRNDKVRVMALPWMFGKYPIREAKERFEKRHPGVQVELLKSPGESCQKLLVAMLSGRSDCDVLLGPNETDVINFAARDLLLPWDDFVASKPAFSRDKFVSAYFDMVNFGGVQYALPVSGELICLTVNRKMARAAGLLNDSGQIRFAKSWGEVFDYAQRMSLDQNGDGKFERYGLAINWSFGEHIHFATVQAGEGRIRGASNEIICDAPSIREMMTLAREHAAKGHLSLACLTDRNADRNDMKAGLAAMIMTHHSRWREVQEVLGDGATTVMPVPGANAGSTCAFALNVVIPRNSCAVELSRAFVEEEFFAPYFSQYAFTKYGKLPCHRATMDGDQSDENRQLQEWAGRSTHRPLVRDIAQLIDTIECSQAQYLAKEIELDAMFNQMKDSMSRLDLRDIREDLKKA